MSLKKNLGHATAYGYAKSKGYDGTEEEYAELMADFADAAETATAAEAAAVTAKEAAQAAQTAAETAASTATTKASDAATSASNAAASESSVAANAQTASSAASTATSAASAAGSAQTAAETAQGAAESARTTAVSKASEASGSASAAAAAQTAAETAQGKAETAQSKAEDAQEAAETAQTAAESAKDTAVASAGTASTDAATATTKAGEAASSASTASANALKSEGYAVGKQGGSDVSSTSPYYHANAKYYSEQAASSASDAATAKTAAEAAQTAAETAAATLTVDSAMSDSSTNPVQNRVIKGEIDDVKSALSELKDIVTAELSPAQIQAIAASGHADDYFSIGDIIYCKWTDKSPNTPVEYNVPMVVTHFGDVYDENGDLHENAMWLMWMYATPQTLQFDAEEAIVATESTFQEGYYYYTKNNDDSFTQQTVTVGATIPSGTTYYKHVRSGMATRMRYGSNDWSQSAYRQWLNSDAGKGSWWEAQHDSDVAPPQASTLPGFLTGFEQEWLDIFKPIKVQTALNTVCDGGVTAVTYDKFFLPSLEQMYGSPQASGVEGAYWEYWKQATGLTSPSNGSSSNTNDARKIPSISAPTGSAVSCRLRSASRSGADGTWSGHSAGYLYRGHAASNSFRAQPACVIY